MSSLYQEHILDHYRNPRCRAPVPGATHRASVHNPSCGDSLAMDILVRRGKIQSVGWSGSGCAISQASASLLSERVLGMKIADAAALPKEAVLELLGISLSPTRLKCALLSLEALHQALRSNS